MTLRLRLMLVTSAVVFVLFGLSEWMSYRQTAALLERHEAILVETADHTVALEKLQETRTKMFWSVTRMRIVHAVLTLILAVAILNYVWYRTIYRPIGRLLAQINIMGRGTWKSALPVQRKDEIGQLTTAFNDLGQQLTSTFRHINSSSRLSAMALIGHRLVREVNAARGGILTVAYTLETASHTDVPTLAAIAGLKSVHAKLEGLETRFQRDFDQEVVSVSPDS
ncbi:MAG: HAMP domain-containing protein [Bryobacteraceae bacterium]